MATEHPHHRRQHDLTADERLKLAFQFFNEVGIIHQLAATAFNKRLPEGVHVSHFGVINHMVRLGDGETPLALASAFQVTKGTMSHTLSGLAKREFVRIEPHETDRRSKRVFLTERGREFHRTAIESVGPLVAMLQESLDINKLFDALPVLREVREVLDTHRDI